MASEDAVRPRRAVDGLGHSVKSLPPNAEAYRRTPEFTASTIPPGLMRQHRTKRGVWGRIRVLEGSLLYRVLSTEREEHVLSPAIAGVVEPEVPHEIEPIGPVRFYVEFLRVDGAS